MSFAWSEGGAVEVGPHILSDEEVRSGLRWAYRILLNRDPESDAVIDQQTSLCRTPAEIRDRFMSSQEFADRLDTIGSVPSFRDEIAGEDGVLWAFRLILGREPSREELVAHTMQERPIARLKRNFVLSREYELRCNNVILRRAEVFNAFSPFAGETTPQGFFRNFLGVLTRCEFLPSDYQNKSGTTDRHPKSNGLHGYAEWEGALRSVLEADNQFTVMELGAGWGPWLTACAAAAKRVGIELVRLVGVEASDAHFDFMLQHFHDNGLNPEDHRLYHAAVGIEDGIARFPRLHQPSNNYGTPADFEHQHHDVDEVRCIGLSTLLNDVGNVDLLHIDIQGHESSVLSAAVEELCRSVRRLIIGTHSRSIEGELLHLLSGRGWIVEDEQACRYSQFDDGNITLSVDGEQVWRNSRLQ